MDKKSNSCSLENLNTLYKIYYSGYSRKPICKPVHNHNVILEIFSLTNLQPPCDCIPPFIKSDTSIKKTLDFMRDVSITHNGKLIHIKTLARTHEIRLMVCIKEILPKELCGIVCDYACIFHHYSHKLKLR